MNGINQVYEVEAACPQFKMFLERIWRDDADQAEKIAFLRQWMGYLLVADTSLQKMLILKGDGANGKTLLMDVVRAMIGERNSESAMLDRLRMPYVRATLVGKLLNQSADLPKRGIVADGDLKAIVSGDPIEVSPKYKPSYTIVPYARLMVATNNMPNSKDTSEGYFRRLMILPFNRIFPESERNPELRQSLMAEMSGIIAWAIGGLYDLRTRGQFTIPCSSMQAVQAYRDDISPVRLFAEECLTHSTGKFGLQSKNLFMAFRSWCRDRGFDAGDATILGRDLAALGFNSRKSSTTVWLVTPKDGSQAYFTPGQVVVEGGASNPPPPLQLAA
jgi:putative DNA primase/helicase